MGDSEAEQEGRESLSRVWGSYYYRGKMRFSYVVAWTFSCSAQYC